MTVARIKDDGRVGLVMDPPPYTPNELGLVWVLVREPRKDGGSGLGVQCFWPEEIEAIN
jgi:hypothetical protein